MLAQLAAARQSGQGRFGPATGGSFSALDAPSTEIYSPAPARFTLPQVFLDSRYAPGGVPLTFTDVTVTVTGTVSTDTAALQDAIDAAADRAGHTRIRISGTGGVFQCLRLRQHTAGAFWTYIEASNLSYLTAEGVRCDTAAFGTSAPTIRSGPNGEGGIVCDQGVDRYRFTGIHFDAPPNVTPAAYFLVQLHATSTLGSEIQTLAAHAPQWIIFDRCWFDGRNENNVRIGLILNSREAAVVDCVFDGIYKTGDESKAIVSYNGAGPHKIVNNTLEGASINIMWGGADPAIEDLIPSDLEFRRNWCVKRNSWLRHSPDHDLVSRSVKNNFELKFAQRVLVEGNVFEGNSQDGQNGEMIVLKVNNASGTAPWVTTKDVTFRYNRLLRTTSLFQFINVNGQSVPNVVGETMNRIEITHNVADEFGLDAYTASDSNSRFAVYGNGGGQAGSADLVMDHNTFVLPTSGVSRFTQGIIFSGDEDMSGAVWQNNIIAAPALYGISGDGSQSVSSPIFGTNVLAAYAPGYAFDHNVMVLDQPVNNDPAWYPATNEYPEGQSDIGFVSLSGGIGGDYRLTTLSTYKGFCADGSDPGANIDAVDLATSGVTP